MYLSEKEYKKLCEKLGKTKAMPKFKNHEKQFDSLAEQNFYYLYIVEKLTNGEIIDCQLHSEFVIIDDIPEYGLRKKVFKPDFKITLRDGSIFIVEMKGQKVKKLQRDYGLRKHIFIEKYCIPNDWTFIELKSENWTQQPYIEKRKEIFKRVSNK